jgi:hypothetical protein
MKITLEPDGSNPPTPIVAANIRTSLQAAMVSVGPSAPALQPGESITAWFNPTTGRVNFYSGTDPISFTPQHCLVSDTEPPAPVPGTRWFSTSDNFTYTYVNGEWVSDQGPVGPPGPTGPQGNIGPAGVQGFTGPANELSIGNVTRGETAAATIEGIAPSQTLNLVLPKGAEQYIHWVSNSGEPRPINNVTPNTIWA